MKYQTVHHLNSITSRRRGLLVRRNKISGLMERVDHTTVQVFRSGAEGHDLPHMISPQILRANRSKYVPHVGKKHAAKLLRRDLRKPENDLALHA